MGRIRSGHRMALLRLSALGFAVLTGILAFSYFWLFEVIGSITSGTSSSDLRLLVLSFTLPALPGAVLSWWLLVVLPRRSSARAGGCAGLLTIGLAVFGFCVTQLVNGGFSVGRTVPSQIVYESLTFSLGGLVIVSVTPAGWGILLVGGIAGALYGTLIGRRLPETPSGKAASDASPGAKRKNIAYCALPPVRAATSDPRQVASRCHISRSATMN